ncbi:Heterokaryon incompatibility protein 6, OR allele [Pseudocercospora fuligena]|uniref:Heterokaryon incompatibility protein 6, OR allele n=1 Tax=Pseudocercospora fuligena TaxID=685502 RepID=A0A8H6RBD2_9PEZI|nr:Heterokaryon incompatibility protein 6, OR allele [Pseudocercospora fuligena]
MENSSDSDWDPSESSDNEAYGFTDEPDQGPAQNPRIPLPNVDDIRVFTIDLDAGSDVELIGYFQRVSINNPLPYCALSYAWGKIHQAGSHLTHHVHFDGEALKITKTLYQALVRIRQMYLDEGRTDPVYKPPALWVDAICIDQDDPIERSRQVMMMGQIYASARRLLVWLEDDMPASSNVDEIRQTTDMAYASGSLLQRKYFTRMWVVQEAICAHAVQCTLLFNRFRSPVSNLAAILEDREVAFAECEQEENKGHELQLNTLMMNLLKFRRKQCSDARDRVYALKSISCDGQAVLINYSQTCESLYVALAEQWIDRGHICAMMLSAGLLDRRGQGRRALPSWVPDWRLAGYRSKHASAFMDAVAHIISKASLADNHRRNVTKASNSKDGLLLKIRGWLIPACGHYIAPLRNTLFQYLSISECIHCHLVQTDVHYHHSTGGLPATLKTMDSFFIPDQDERYFFRLGEYDAEQDSHILLHLLLCPSHDDIIKDALAGDVRFKPALQTVRLR